MFFVIHLHNMVASTQPDDSTVKYDPDLTPTNNSQASQLFGRCWRGQEDIVISGISGRFPQSDNMAEFAQNLYSATDMVTIDNSRWEPGKYGNPERHGKVRTLAKFDPKFFGVPPVQVEFMDPGLRNLLHTAYEAICDAGISPASLRGSRTGVFVGITTSESLVALTRDPDLVSGHTTSGCANSMFANRLSFAFNFNGPSFALDTACNSSLLALQLALSSIREGQCDSALVCGANTTLTATSCLQYTRLGVLAPDGACRSFDADATGYCRAEGIGVVLLQRRSAAFRLYATIIHAKSNNDGWKKEGVHWPSGAMQGRLLREVYAECGVDPADVAYVEAHGTGTKVGDPQEVNTIADVFCKPGSRDQPLKIGSVKSNMGHAEPSAGVASIAKVVLAMETGVIAPNLHYVNPNPNIPSLTDGRISVCDKPTPWEGGYTAINSCGFGGSNTHVLLLSNPDDARPLAPLKSSLPKLFCFASRTEAGLERVFDAVEKNDADHHFYSLLANQAQAPLKLHHHRGYLILRKADGGGSVRAHTKVGYERRPLYLIFNGMGAQWVGMGQDLMDLEPFRASVLQSAQVTRELGIDLCALLSSTNVDVFKNVCNAIVCNVAVQIALVDVLLHLGITWDGVVGHSTGEIACAYADGALDRKQALSLAFARGETIGGAKLAPGAMAAVGLSWDEIERRLKGTDVVAACHNSADSVTVSGPADAVQVLVEKLEGEGIFARVVDSSGIAFHSPAISPLKDILLERFSAIIPRPSARQPGWVSSSVGADSEEAWASLSGPEYHAHNVVSPVRFHAALSSLPRKAVTLEIGGHNLLAAILRRSLPAPASHVGLTSKKAPSGLDFLLEGLGKLFSTGAPVHFERLYPAVTWPAPRGTPMISSLIAWDETAEFTVHSGSGEVTGAGGSVVTFDPYTMVDDAYLLDHHIDGRSIFPFTGYPVMAWEAVAKAAGRDMNETSVVFSELKVLRATSLAKAVKFTVQFSAGDNGDFHVLESGSVVATGNIKILDDPKEPFFFEHLQSQDIHFDPTSEGAESTVLNSQDIYKEYNLHGYEYGPHFRGIHSLENDGTASLLRWDPQARNWVTFLDSMFQADMTSDKNNLPAGTMKLPVRLRYLRIDPQRQMDSVFTAPDGTSVLLARSDAAGHGTACGGVELRDLSFLPAQRRLSRADDVVEKMAFVPFEEDACFADLPELRQTMNNVGVSVGAALACWLEEIHRQSPGTFADHPLGPYVESILDDLWAQYISPRRDYDKDEIRKRIVSAEDLANSKNLLTEQSGLNLQESVWGFFTQPRALRMLVSLAVFNVRTRKFRLLLVEPPELRLAAALQSYVTDHPGLSVRTLLSYHKIPVETSDYETLEIDWRSGGRELAGTETFHLTVLDRVLSKTGEIQRFLGSVKQSLKEEGFLLVNEVTSGFARNAAMELFRGRGNGPLNVDSAGRCGLFLNDVEWRRHFTLAGLVVVGAKADPAMDTSTYLLRRQPDAALRPLLVDCDDVSEFPWVLELQSQADPSRTVVATSARLTDNGITGLINCLREEDIAQNRYRGLANVSLDPATPPLDLRSGEAARRLATLDLHLQLYRDGVWGCMEPILAQKGTPTRVDTPNAFLNTARIGDMASFDWIEGPDLAGAQTNEG